MSKIRVSREEMLCLVCSTLLAKMWPKADDVKISFPVTGASGVGQDSNITLTREVYPNGSCVVSLKMQETDILQYETPYDLPADFSEKAEKSLAIDPPVVRLRYFGVAPATLGVTSVAAAIQTLEDKTGLTVVESYLPTNDYLNLVSEALSLSPLKGDKND